MALADLLPKPPGFHVPAWVPPVVRFFLAVALIFIGLNGWADGYGATLVAIGSGSIVAELVGAGLTTSQAQQVIQLLTTELARYQGATPAPASPPPSPPTAP